MVKRVFKRFIEIQSPKQIAYELNQEGILTNQGKDWSVHHIYRMLNNYTYIGKIYYKGEVFDGKQERIISDKLWERTQEILQSDAPVKDFKGKVETLMPLKGLLYCGHCGCRMGPTYAKKRRYDVFPLPLHQGQISAPPELNRYWRNLIMKTTIEPLEDGNTRIRIPIEFRYDNGRKRIFFPEMPDEHLKINEPLATGIARAYRWQELLDKGEYDSPESLAEALGVHTSYVRRFLRLALLAPPIVDAIFAGKAPWTLSLTKLDTTLPYSWKVQMELFGMGG